MAARECAHPDAAGRLRELRQGRWRVHYREYTRIGEIWLPRKITIQTKSGEDEITMKILLQSWRNVRFGG